MLGNVFCQQAELDSIEIFILPEATPLEDRATVAPAAQFGRPPRRGRGNNKLSAMPAIFKSSMIHFKFSIPLPFTRISAALFMDAGTKRSVVRKF
ncbi:hypothetical protein V6Z77_010220 [Aspergillus fumigatus]